MTPVKW